jgi:cyanate permease
MAATGPLIVSVLRSASGGFVVAFLLLAGLCAAASMIARSVVHSAARLPSTPQ